MGILSVSLTFVGYLLVYASVANHGKFAKEPWLGVATDAYEVSDPTASGKSGADAPLAGSTSVIPRGTNVAGQGPVPA